MGIQQFAPREGMNVYGSDGEKIGDVDAIQNDHFVVRKGFFFPEDHYIPVNAISKQTEDGIYLNVTKDQALEQDWNVAPQGGANYETDAGVAAGGSGFEHDPEPFLHDQDTQRTHVNEGDGLRVDIHEEELAAHRRPVERGEVRINKDVIEEEQSIDVPVTEEEVEISRRRVNRDAHAGDGAFEEGTVEVPLRGEELEVEKRARVVEEIDVDKTAHTHNERVSDTVRREEVEVEGEKVGPESGRGRR